MLIPVTAHYAPVTLPDAPNASDCRMLIEPYQAMIMAQFAPSSTAPSGARLPVD